MNITQMRTLLRKRGPLAFPLVAGYFALHYAKRHKTKTALIVTGGGLGLALLSYSVGQITPQKGSLNVSSETALRSQDAAAAYTVTDLGTLGGNISIASAINNRGQVAGTSELKDESVHGYVWNGGKMSDIGTLGGSFSLTTGLNNNGAAVGISMTSAEDAVHAFAWSGGKMSAAEPKDALVSVATAINDSGAVVGLAVDKQEEVYSYILKGDRISKFFLAGSQRTVGTGINASGTVAGFGVTEANIKSFTLSEGKFRPLPGLRGADAVAEAINERGDVAGGSFLNESDTIHAVLWRNGKPNDLGTLPGLPDSVASSVNRDGVVVGIAFPPQDESVPNFSQPSYYAPRRHSFPDLLAYQYTRKNLTLNKFSGLAYALDVRMEAQALEMQGDINKNEIPHAFVWRDGKMTDMNKLLPSGSGWVLAVATGINDRGQITGIGLHKGKVRAFLLSPKS